MSIASAITALVVVRYYFPILIPTATKKTRAKLAHVVAVGRPKEITSTPRKAQRLLLLDFLLFTN